MTEAERRHIYLRTLHHMETGQYDYAILEDSEHPDNYIQFGALDDTHQQLLVEITSRSYPDQELSPLSPEQIERLVALGFSTEADPNHAQHIPFDDLPKIARLFEEGFVILGCEPAFELRVRAVGFWSTNPIQIEAVERDDALYRRGR